MTKARTLADNFAADINGITAGTGITGGGTSGTVTITNEMATTITAKGDLLAGTGNAAFDNLAAGASGETLVADSSTTTGLRYQGLQAAGRNFIINGDQAIAQRGTSLSSVTAGAYLTDRFTLIPNTMGTWTLSQESDAPAGFSKSLKALVTTNDAAPAAADRVFIVYKNEGNAVQTLSYGSASAKTVTVSFYVKSNVTGTYVLELVNVQPSTSRHIAATYSISSSATWEKKTITFVGDTATAIIADSAERLTAVWWLGAGSNFTSGTLATSWADLNSANRAVGQTNVAASNDNYFQITGVQMEIGSVATPFQTATGTLAGELAACQRYYWRNQPGALYSAYGSGMATSTTVSYSYIPFPVDMRTTPTVVDFANIGFGDLQNGIAGTSAIGTVYNGTKGIFLQVNGTYTQYRPGNVMNNNNTGGYLGFGAEL